MATAGDTSSETTGTATARARIVRASRQTMEIAGEDSNITGNSVHIDIDHRPTGLKPQINAAATGLSRGPQNDNATSRRLDSLGHATSANVGRDGQAAISVTTTGIAT